MTSSLCLCGVSFSGVTPVLGTLYFSPSVAVGDYVARRRGEEGGELEERGPAAESLVKRGIRHDTYPQTLLEFWTGKAAMELLFTAVCRAVDSPVCRFQAFRGRPQQYAASELRLGVPTRTITGSPNQNAAKCRVPRCAAAGASEWFGSRRS
jgi:hypothetical protein